mgnify:FL=1|jgi:hypothetical protein
MCGTCIYFFAAGRVAPRTAVPCAVCSTYTEEYRDHIHLNVCVCFCILKYVMYNEPMHFKNNKLYLQTAIKKGDISPISEISP